jgi:TolB-like protein/Tfp pilus assembly protein PilF
MSFWGELRRRNVFKVGVAYLIVAWLLIQVAGLVFPQLQLPAWAPTLVTVLLIIGFPVALVLAWAYEITPEGIKQTSDAPVATAGASTTGRKLDFLVIALLAVALGYVIIDQYFLEGPGVAEAAVPRLAVLPCENQSPEASDAYFAAQMHEEILNQLAKLSGLRVIARTSVMQYAAARPAIAQIARDLDAAAIMECSVRYAGTDIRVTAQLIDPETDEQLWSEAYPGDIGDVRAIFAMQADIAMNIANALNAEYSAAEQTRIEQAPTESATAYSLFLEARDLYNESPTNFAEVLVRLDRALGIDPEFAEALGYRASVRAYFLINALSVAVGDQAQRDTLQGEIAADVDRALALDESVGYAWLARGLVAEMAFQWSSADAAFARAVELTPNSPEVLREYAPLKALRREPADAIRLIERAIDVAPNDFTTYIYLVNTSLWAGYPERGLETTARLIELNPSFAPARHLRGMLQLQLGQRADAESNLRAGEGLMSLDPNLRGFWPPVAYGYQRLGLAEDAQRLSSTYLSQVDAAAIGTGERLLLSLAVDDVAGAYEAVETARERIERGEIDAGYFALVTMMTNPHRDPRLDEPRFRAEFDRIFEIAMSR